MEIFKGRVSQKRKELKNFPVDHSIMKCTVEWCPEVSEAEFRGMCPDHFREWLATLKPQEKSEALGPLLDFPHVLSASGEAELSGKFIFYDRGNGVPEVSQDFRPQVAVKGS